MQNVNFVKMGVELAEHLKNKPLSFAFYHHFRISHGADARRYKVHEYNDQQTARRHPHGDGYAQQKRQQQSHHRNDDKSVYRYRKGARHNAYIRP